MRFQYFIRYICDRMCPLEMVGGLLRLELGLIWPSSAMLLKRTRLSSLIVTIFEEKIREKEILNFKLNDMIIQVWEAHFMRVFSCQELPCCSLYTLISSSSFDLLTVSYESNAKGKAFPPTILHFSAPCLTPF